MSFSERKISEQPINLCKLKTRMMALHRDNTEGEGLNFDQSG